MQSNKQERAVIHLEIDGQHRRKVRLDHLLSMETVLAKELA